MGNDFAFLVTHENLSVQKFIGLVTEFIKGGYGYED